MSLKNITSLDLIEACQEPGCPVCNLQQKIVTGYLRMLFHEHLNDPPSREKLRLSQGLCHTHLWLAIDSQLSNALAVAILSHDVLGKLLQDLDALNPGSKPPGRIKNLRKSDHSKTGLAPEKPCPACQHQAMVEEWICKVLIESIHMEELSAAIRQSEGVCLPHLRSTLAIKASAESQQILITLTRERWNALQAELAEFIRKNDYRYSQEGFGEERDAWLRASTSIASNRPLKS